MENEHQILDEIEKNGSITQRDIAKKTGMSLGAVNILIKRLARKGLLKIERLNSRTIRYILTPKGLKQKAEATYRYFLYSYRYINSIETKIDMFLDNQAGEGLEKVVLFGKKDDVLVMLKNKLKARKIVFEYIEDIEEVKKEDRRWDTIFIVWQSEYQEVLSEIDIKYVNLFESV